VKVVEHEAGIAGVFDRANCHEARLPIRYSLQDREQPTTGP
jgi:hypothetical protein